MKVFLIFFPILLSAAYCAKADTTDYWHVYYNKKDIAQFPIYFQKPKVNIKRANILKNDSITVRYGTDTPNPNDEITLYVFDNRKKKIALATNKGTWNPLTVSLTEILKRANLYHTKSLEFYYSDKRHDHSIFKLKLE